MYAALAELEANTGVLNSQILVDGLAALKRRIHSEIGAMQSKIAFKNEPTKSEIPNNGKSIEVKVKCCSGNGVAINIKIDVNNTVYDLKSKIDARQGVPPDQQRLLFGHKILEDDHTLNNYNIKNGSVLVMMLHLRGC